MAVEVQTSARVKGEKGDLDADVGSRMSNVECRVIVESERWVANGGESGVEFVETRADVGVVGTCLMLG